MYLEERQAGGEVSGPRSVTVFGVRGDEGTEADDTTVGEQLGYFGNSPTVFHAIFRGKAQVLVEALTNVVAVQTVGRYPAPDEEFF